MQREPGCECDYERGRGTTSGREYIVAGRFVTSDASDEGVRISIPTVFQREEWKAESQPHGGEVKKATLFLLRGKRGGEAGKPDLGPELEGFAQFTSNATAAILAAITVLIPTGRLLVTPQVHSSPSPLLLTKRLESGRFILPASSS